MLPITNLRYLVSDTSSENPPGSSHQEGLALLIAVIALSVFSLLGLYVSLMPQPKSASAKIMKAVNRRGLRPGRASITPAN